MENGMDRITLLDEDRRDKFTRPVARIGEAQRIQSRLHHERPVQRDMIAEYDGIAAWGTVANCYSGTEQAMKCLLQMRGAYVGKKRKHHKIGKLFHELAEEERAVLHEAYRIYRSLHDYIPPQTVADFLEAIDAGYTSWRYFLLDGNMPPTTHPGAMIEIWSALCGILSARVFTNHGLYSVEKRIAHHLKKADQDARSAWLSMTDGRRELEDIGRWRKQSHYKTIINAYIDLFFQHAQRNLERIETLPSTKQLLKAMVGIVEEGWFDNDFAYFLDRARKGEIVWRPDARVFERTAGAEEIANTLIESERADVAELFLDDSVKETRVESVPDHIADFIFARQFAEDDWSSEEGVWEARVEDYGQRLEGMEAVEGGSKCEGYRCRINGIELVIVLYDSKEWVVYRYENRDVPGVPYHCKRISGKLRSMREAIKTIERWRRTE